MDLERRRIVYVLDPNNCVLTRLWCITQLGNQHRSWLGLLKQNRTNSLFIHSGHTMTYEDLTNISTSIDNIQANFDISNSKGMGKTLRVFRSSRQQIMTSREFMYMNKNVFTFISLLFRTFVKIGIATKHLYVCIIVYSPNFFTHKYRGQIMGGLVQPTKLLDHFLNGTLAGDGAFSAN